MHVVPREMSLGSGFTDWEQVSRASLLPFWIMGDLIPLRSQGHQLSVSPRLTCHRWGNSWPHSWHRLRWPRQSWNPVSRALILSKEPNLLPSSDLFTEILQQLLSELSSPEPKAFSCSSSHPSSWNLNFFLLVCRVIPSPRGCCVRLRYQYPFRPQTASGCTVDTTANVGYLLIAGKNPMKTPCTALFLCYISCYVRLPTSPATPPSFSDLMGSCPSLQVSAPAPFHAWIHMASHTSAEFTISTPPGSRHHFVRGFFPGSADPRILSAFSFHYWY